PTRRRPVIEWTSRGRKAVRTPPLSQKSRLAPGLENELAGYVEYAFEDQLRVRCGRERRAGTIAWHHASSPWLATVARRRPDDRNVRPARPAIQHEPIVDVLECAG